LGAILRVLLANIHIVGQRVQQATIGNLTAFTTVQALPLINAQKETTKAFKETAKVWVLFLL
jgi:hypothetical protein